MERGKNKTKGLFSRLCWKRKGASFDEDIQIEEGNEDQRLLEIRDNESEKFNLSMKSDGCNPSESGFCLHQVIFLLCQTA